MVWSLRFRLPGLGLRAFAFGLPGLKFIGFRAWDAPGGSWVGTRWLQQSHVIYTVNTSGESPLCRFQWFATR